MNAGPERAESLGDGETLQLLVGGGDGEPEMLLLLERPANGLVRVRSWTSGDWSAAPTAGERDAHALLSDIERWARAGRSLNHPLAAVRRWLSQRRR